MSKSQNSGWLFVIAAAILVFGINGCRQMDQPNPLLSTRLPQFNHYPPSDENKLQIEFDYPYQWRLEEVTQYNGITIINLTDSRLPELPTLEPGMSHYPPVDFSSVSIFASSINPVQSLVEESASFKNKNGPVQSERKVKVDGRDGVLFEYFLESGETYALTMFEKRISFMTSDQFYIIYLAIPEENRGGEFEQGFEYFFNSLRILP